MISHETYMMSEGNSPWQQVPGWNLLLNFEDLMHNALLGHAGDAICSVLRDLLDERLLGGDTEAHAIETLSVEFRLWCGMNIIRYPTGMFTLQALGLHENSSYPGMQSRVKAAHVRIMIPFVALKARELCTNTWESQLRSTMIRSLAAFFHCLDHAGKWLNFMEQKHALHCGNLYLASYHQLAVLNFDRRRLNYKVRPKCHYFCHQILGQIEGSALNPRHVHCFADEDFMGRVAKLAKRTPGLNTSMRTTQRWLLYLAQRWHQVSSA